MDRKAQLKAYWQEFSPLWWEEIKLWFGWTDLLSAFIKSGIQVLAVLIVLMLGGSAESFFETAAVQLVVYIIVFIFLEVILLVTYHRAGKKLYENQARIIDDQESKLSDVENSKPVIRAKNPVVAEKGFQGGIKKDAISISVWNISPNSVAEKVYATVTWFNSHGKKVTENHGRWWISTEDQAKLRSSEMQTVDLHSNGMANDLHFAIEAPGEKPFHAWHRENDGSEKFTGLDERKYRVKIHLQSSNSAVADYDYRVKNENGKLSIKEIRKMEAED